MKLLRLLRTATLYGLLFAVGFGVTLAIVSQPKWASIRGETARMVRAHVSYQVDHPGWSFPGRVWSAPAPLDLPPDRLAAHAEARGYRFTCPAVEPGDFCAEDGVAVPRGGRFAEGDQPPGLDGWTRPPALEPVLVGWLIGDHAEIREHLPIDRAPPHLIQAIIAAEDDAYYDHFGVNPRGVLRAAWVNARGEGLQQGASTITMQVVRNLSQRKDRTIQRKVHEALAAVAIDRDLGKEGVLQIYLDAPYLGQWGSFSICGFQAAARYYYGVDAADLDLAQAATLASILPAPGRFAPDRHPERARARRDRTLDRMVVLGMVPAAEAAQAKTLPADATPVGLPDPRFPAYLQATRAWLEDALPAEEVTGSGLEVHTALDVVAQAHTERVLAEQSTWLEKQVGRGNAERLQAAGALVDVETGLLVATYGGTQELATDFNRATQAQRQSGSSIKPLVYALAFSQTGDDGAPTWKANSTVRNTRRVFPDTDGWMPRNVGGKYSTTSTLAMGLSWSENVATASLLEELGGAAAFKGFAQRLGFDTTGWRDELGLALGTGEVSPLAMARFVATVLNEGRLASGRPVVSAHDAGGVTRVAAQAPRQQALDPRAAALTRDLMRLVIEYGTGGATRAASGKPGFGGPAVGKTGTTDSEKDLWFVGGTGHYAGALWLGYDRPQRIGASASDLAAPLWGWWMRAVHDGLPERELPGLDTVRWPVCTQTGLRGNGTCRLIGAPFLARSEIPRHACGVDHPPPDPTVEKYEGLWRRKAREQAEAEEAEQAEAEEAEQTGE